MAQSYEDLEIWRASRRLATKVYALASARSGLQRDWDLCRQMRRSAVSVVSNIAEGFDRGTNKEFLHFLHIAKGSVAELRTQLYLTCDLGYVDSSTTEQLLSEYQVVSRQIGRLITYLKASARSGHAVRDADEHYSALPGEVIPPTALSEAPCPDHEPSGP
jgi:four helix bundle protein